MQYGRQCPIPTAGDEKASAQADLGTTRWLVVRKDFEHPEALIKMANLFIEKCWVRQEIILFIMHRQ